MTFLKHPVSMYRPARHDNGRIRRHVIIGPDGEPTAVDEATWALVCEAAGISPDDPNPPVASTAEPTE